MLDGSLAVNPVASLARADGAPLVRIKVQLIRATRGRGLRFGEVE
jgi:hypothetical protein